MAQNGLDHQQLFFEIDTRDEPVFVTAYVKDQRAGGRCVIGGRKRHSNCRKMRPDGVADDDYKPLQRLAGGWVLPGKSRNDGFAENLHIFMFPLLGTLVKSL
jgi:hypothetical protein